NRYQIDLWGLMPWSGSALHTWGELIANWFLLPNLNIFGRRFGMQFTTGSSFLAQLKKGLENTAAGAVRLPGVANCPECTAEERVRAGLAPTQQQIQDAFDIITRAQQQQQQRPQT
ncbi:MAG: hypothetical protein V1798_06990, partial [Pseudomonadota bacterium]